MSQHALAAHAADVEAAEGIMRRGRRQIPPGQAPAACLCALRAIGEPGHHPLPSLPLCGK